MRNNPYLITATKPHQSPLLLLPSLRLLPSHRGAFAVCRIGHKNDDPSRQVAVKSLMRDHPNFDTTALKHEISIMQVWVCTRKMHTQEDTHTNVLVDPTALAQTRAPQNLSNMIISHTHEHTFTQQAINHPRCINLIEVREDEAAVHLVYSEKSPILSKEP